jgi:hypothetical protein
MGVKPCVKSTMMNASSLEIPLIPLKKWDFECPVPSFLRRVREDRRVLKHALSRDPDHGSANFCHTEAVSVPAASGLC